MRRVVALILATALLVAACYTGPGADHYSAVLDELTIPSDWTLVKTSPRGPGLDVQCDPVTAPRCPAVTRYYVSPLDPADAFAAGEGLVVSAGFTVTQEMSPTCVLPPQGAACVFLSGRGDDRINMYIYRSPSEVDGLGPVDATGTTVLIEANGPK